MSNKLLHKDKKVKKKSSLAWRSTWELSLLSLPGFIYFLIFAYIPMFGIVLAFKNFNYGLGIFGSPWVGLENFKYLFTSGDAPRILRNTILYNLAALASQATISVVVALMLDAMTKKIQVKFYQTALFLPHFISWIVVAFVTQALFSLDTGFINNILKSIGKEPVSWYTTTKPWPYILVFATVWKSFGYQAIIYYGSLIGIDPQLYDAAAIDGASKLQTIRKITIPTLRPTIIMLTILGIGNILRSDFGMFYYLPNNQGALYEVTDVLGTYIYRSLRVLGDVSSSSAASVFESVVGFALVITTNAIIRKIDSESAMF